MAVAFDVKNRKRPKRRGDSEKLLDPKHTSQSDLGAPASAPLYLRSPSFEPYSTLDTTYAATTAAQTSTPQPSAVDKADTPPPTADKAESKGERKDGAAAAQPQASSTQQGAGGKAAQKEQGGADAQGAHGARQPDAQQAGASIGSGRTSGGAQQDPFDISIEEEAASEQSSSEAADDDGGHLVVQPLQSWTPFVADWTAPVALANEAFKFPPAPPKHEGAKQDGNTGINASVGARALAQRIYADLVREARSSQGEFAGNVNHVNADMSQAFEQGATKLVSAHEQALEELGRAHENAEREINQAADTTDFSIQNAYRLTTVSLRLAARRANGRIAANYQTAGAQIEAILAALVSGHEGAFDGAISSVQSAATQALTTLQEWSNARASKYSSTKGSGLQRAQNEGKQREIPKLVRQETDQLTKRKDNTIKNWTTTKTSTVCALKCGYRGPLDKRKEEINKEGYAAVANALLSARQQLAQQTREGRKAVRDMRNNLLSQVRAQQRAARTRLVTEARATLTGMRGETQAAMSGMNASARVSLAGYPRTAQRFDEMLRRASERGPSALELTARQASANLTNSMLQTHRQQTERAPASGQRLSANVSSRLEKSSDTRREQLAQVTTTLEQTAQDAAAQLSKTATSYTSAFGKFSNSITQTADSWAAPLAQHFAKYIKDSSKDAQGKLNSLRTGEPEAKKGTGDGTGAAPKSASPANKGAPGKTADGEGATPDCGCPQSEGGEGKQGPSPTGKDAKSSGGLDGQIKDETEFLTKRAAPDEFFKERLDQIGQGVTDNIKGRVDKIAHAFEAGIIDKVDEGAVTGALHGLSVAGGLAVQQVYYDDYDVPLVVMLADKLWKGSDDYNSAMAYLQGDPVKGAQYELKASLGIFNDDEARIEQTMRALSPDQLKELGSKYAGVMEDVRSSLDGTDLEVFQALEQGNHAKADAYRLRDKINEARRDGDADAVHAAIAQYSHETEDAGWEIEGDTAKERGKKRREAVMAELGGIVSDAEVAQAAGKEGVKGMSNVDRAVAFATRDIVVPTGGGGPHGEPRTKTLSITGANRDLTDALIRYGEGSPQARAARMGVEYQRGGDGPKAINADTALFDERFVYISPTATKEQRAEIENSKDYQDARKERQEAMLLFAQTYGGVSKDVKFEEARDIMIGKMQARFGDDQEGAKLIAGMMKDERPSPQTASLAMQHAMYSHVGTNEELLYRFTERMNRDEVKQMRAAFKEQTKKDLDEELGTFGKGGTFTELSGDDRLRMEIALMGVPQNEKEELEVANMRLRQQKEETGGLGKWLAGGSLAEKGLNKTEQRLLSSAGVTSKDFDEMGELKEGAGSLFDKAGKYTGTRREAFLTAAHSAKQIAENYSSRIDAYANFAASSIAVLGAIVAAVVSIATGGLAAPLLMAAIAGATGLLSMGARSLISGGRYGWEQAATDLGMTAVQAVTAGVGQKLALVSRGIGAAARPQLLQQFMAGRIAANALPQMGKITGSALGDMVLSGAVTSGMGKFGETALSEQTWEKGLGHGFGELFSGTVRGMATGATTALASQAFESIPAGRVVPGVGRPTLGSIGGESTSMLWRAGAKGLTSAGSAFVGREVELGLDPRYRGDAGEMLMSGFEAAGQSFIQDAAGGAVEAPITKGQHKRQLAYEQSQAQTPHAPGKTPEPHEVSTTKTHAPAEHEPTTTRAPHEPEPMPAPHATPPTGQVSPKPAAPTHVAAEPTPAHAPQVEPTPTTHAEEAHDAARLALHEETERQAQARTGATTESEAGAPPRPTAPETEQPPPTRPAREFAEGTASAVRDSDFHGSSAKPGSPEAVHPATVRGALRRLLATGEFSSSALPQPADPTRIMLRTHNGEDVMVRVRLSNSPLPPEDGMSPVARFERDPHTGEYIVTVSAGAQKRHVERALAHELTEIRAGHGRRETLDVLVPRRLTVVPEEGKTPRLSPHDEGRLAELGVIARQLQTERNPKERMRLYEDAEQLVAHLGLAGLGNDSAARRVIAHEALKNLPDVQELLVTSVLAHHPEAVRLGEVGEMRRSAARSGLVDEDMLELPGAPAMTKRKGDPRAGRSEFGETPADAAHIKDSLREEARDAFARVMREALLDPSHHTELTQKTLEYMTPEDVEFLIANRRMPPGFEFHHILTVSDYPEFAHLAEVGLSLPKDVHRQVAHGGETTREVEAGTFVDPAAEGRPPFINDTEAIKGRRRWTDREVAEATRSTGDMDRDIEISQRAQLKHMEHRAKQLEEDMPNLQRREGWLDKDVTRIEKSVADAQDALNRARASGESTVEHEEHLSKLEERLSERQEDLRDLRARIASLPTLKAQIAAMPAQIDALVAAAKAAKAAQPTPPPPSPTTPQPASPQPSPPTPAGPAPPAAQAPTPPVHATTPTTPDETAPLSKQTPAAEPGLGQQPELSTTTRTGAETKTPTDEGTSGTASAIGKFRGNATTKDMGARNMQKAVVASEKMLAPGGQFEQHVVRPPGDVPSEGFAIKTRNGETVEVRMEIVDTFTGHPAGEPWPVARFVHDPETGGYKIQISRHAHPEHIEQALAHEIAEIHAKHGRTGEISDALTPGATTRKLSPHDEGRLAEFESLARQISAAQAKGDESLVARLKDLAQHHAAGMGLHEDSAAAAARANLARSALAEGSPARRLLDESISEARTNPFIERRSGNFEDDMQLLFRQLEKAHLMSDMELRGQVVQEVRRLMLADNVVAVTGKGEHPAITYPSQKRVAAALESVPEASRDAMHALIKEGLKAVRENPRLSDWEKRATGQQRTPDKGYEHQFAVEPVARKDVHLDPTTAQAIEDNRNNLISKRKIKEGELKTTTDATRKQKLTEEINDLKAAINKESEALGMVAGRAYSEQQLKLPADSEIKFDRQGAGLPDLLYENPKGHFVIVECKGGTSELGVRRSTDGTLLVEQGTLEYARSLAATMKRSSDAKVRDAGERLAIALAKTPPPNVDYFLVRQPFNATTGKRGTPEVGKFDITKSGPRL